MYIEAMQKKAPDMDNSYLNAIRKIKEGMGNSKAVPAFDPDVWTYDGYFVDTTRIYLDKTVPVSWSQGDPLCSLINDNRGVCAIPAVAQIMAYHKFYYQGGINFDLGTWNSMIAGNNNNAVSILGYSLYNQLYWLFDWITPLPSHICSFFEDDLQCSSSSNHSGFNFTDLLEYLEYGPTILLGFAGPVITNLSEGHYWIADAADKITYNSYDLYHIIYNGNRLDYYVYYPVTSTEYVHYNWGWNSTSDGWYSSGVFSPSSSNDSYEYGLVTIDIVP